MCVVCVVLVMLGCCVSMLDYFTRGVCGWCLGVWVGVCGCRFERERERERVRVVILEERRC